MHAGSGSSEGYEETPRSTLIVDAVVGHVKLISGRHFFDKFLGVVTSSSCHLLD